MIFERTLYAYEDGTDRKFRNVGTKSSDAVRLPKKTIWRWTHGESLKSRLTPTHSECVLGIQHAMRMRHIVICGLPGSTILFHIISQKALLSKKKKVIESKMCVLISYTTYVWKFFLILRRTERHWIKNVYWSSIAVPLFLADFNETRIFSTDFRKILKYQISWKPVQ